MSKKQKVIDLVRAFGHKIPQEWEDYHALMKYSCRWSFDDSGFRTVTLWEHTIKEDDQGTYYSGNQHQTSKHFKITGRHNRARKSVELDGLFKKSFDDGLPMNIILVTRMDGQNTDDNWTVKTRRPDSKTWTVVKYDDCHNITLRRA